MPPRDMPSRLGVGGQVRFGATDQYRNQLHWAHVVVQHILNLCFCRVHALLLHVLGLGRRSHVGCCCCQGRSVLVIASTAAAGAKGPLSCRFNGS